MNHLLKEMAPIGDRAWSMIDDEARRSLKHFLAARRVVDFRGPLGWSESSVDVGRVEQLTDPPEAGVFAIRRVVAPFVEFRSPLVIERSELEAAERGATDIDLRSVISACRSLALAEDGAVFHGYAPGGIEGIAAASPHEAVEIGDDFQQYPERVAKSVALLRGADVAGPYAIAMGERCYVGVTEATELGGYPVFHHLREILGGPIVWAPGVRGAVVLSQRGGDFELTVGQDVSLGYRESDASSVELYLEESMTFRVNSPEASVHLRVE